MNNHYLMQNYKRLPVAFERGQDCWLYDSEGKQYLDALCGISVTNIGHSHPSFVKAVSDQVATLTHTSNLFHIRSQQTLAQSLCEISGMDRAFFCNSGAEANEAAIKLARLHFNNQQASAQQTPAIITFSGSFHGRTLATIAATANSAIKAGFEPALEQFIHLPFNDSAAVEACFAQHSNIAAVLIEPVQGEGGIHIATPEFLNLLQRLCQQHNALFMLDEVQSGNGRCGRYFAHQLLDDTEHPLTPDVVTTAKGLGNGMPIGACLARSQAAEVLGAGTHGSTYGGNPLACTAAQAVIDVIQQQQLTDNANKQGAYLKQGFTEQLASSKLFKEIRQCGLMIGIELNQVCTELMQTGLEHGIVLNVTSGNVIRLLPPLTLRQEQAELLINKVCEVIATLK